MQAEDSKRRSDAADANETLTTAWWRGSHSPLARRFVFLTVLCSSVLALLMTIVQLTVDYVDNQSELDGVVERLEQSFLPSQVESVWSIDTPLVQSQLNGIVQVEGVSFAELTLDDDQKIIAGDPARGHSRAFRFPLLHGDGEGITALGTLEIRVSYEQIRKRLLRRAAIILATNFLKAAVVAAFVLLIYQLLVGQHLSRLARYARDFDLEAPPAPVQLNRKSDLKAGEDELTLLTRAMNEQGQAIHNYVHRLRDTNREQAEFTYAVSHDLRSPTNTVHMLLRELRELNGDSLDEDSKDIFDDLDVTVARMGQLVEDVLAYARSVGEDMSVEEVDLQTEIGAIIHDLSAEISNAGAEITVGELPTVTGSAVQLRLLMQNLISNAIKFRDPARRCLVAIESVPSPERGGATFMVRDNGIGIDQAHHDQIFGLFKRLHTHSSYQGSGIGLTVCQRVVSNHGGKIAITSKQGVGSTFTIVLPKMING